MSLFVKNVTHTVSVLTKKRMKSKAKMNLVGNQVVVANVQTLIVKIMESVHVSTACLSNDGNLH